VGSTLARRAEPRVHLVVGLGNPGKQYERNRHNVGFMVVERLAQSHALPAFKEKFDGLWTKGEVVVGGARHPVALLLPHTFMNLSGDSVQPAAVFLKVDPGHVIVVHDELDLPWQNVRLKVGGGHAGHNGLRSIIQRLGTPDFGRVRVGIGRPPPGFQGDVADWVLSDFDAMERAELPAVVDRACAAVERVIAGGVVAAMKVVNARR
jgi:PTH1 family peptidyl-tRNA hydrolase